MRIVRAVAVAVGCAVLAGACTVLPGAGLRALPSGLPGLSAALAKEPLVVAAVCPGYDDTSATTEIDLFGVDPRTWAPRAEAKFILPANVQIAGRTGETLDVNGRTLFCTHNEDSGFSSEDITARQIFNKNYTLMAVQIDDPATGSHHIGYLDRSGKVTDLTARTGGGAGAHDYNPVFDPSGTSIWYINGDDNQVYTQALNGSPPVAVGTAFTGADPAADETPVLAGSPPRAVVASTFDQIVGVSPSGESVAYYDDSGLHLWRTGRGRVASQPPLPKVTVTGALAGEKGKWATSCTTPGTWISDTTVLCGDRGNFWTLTVHWTGRPRHPVAITPGRLLLPASSDTNADPVLAPGHRIAEYLNVHGVQRTIHELALQPGQKVTPVGQKSKWLIFYQDYRVLEWR